MTDNQIGMMLSLMNREELQEVKEDVDELLKKQFTAEKESLIRKDVCPYCSSAYIKKN